MHDNRNRPDKLHSQSNKPNLSLYQEVPNSNPVYCRPACAYFIYYETEKDGMARTSLFEFRGSPADGKVPALATLPL